MSLGVFNGFIGYNYMNRDCNFTGTDTEELYNENLKLQPADWYYRTCNMSYVRNSIGHRCREINDIDLDNYILFIGCSHTEGVGLSLEDSFTYKLANELKCDYYNLAVGGCGVDTMIHNLNIWLHTVNKKPKYIICQWPDPTRYVSYSNRAFDFHGIWEKHPNVLNFIIAGDMNNFFNGRIKLAKILLEKLNNVITVSVYPNMADIHFNQYDVARDGMHHGRRSNSMLTRLLLEKIHQTKKIV
jgi:hypothetical protein